MPISATYQWKDNGDSVTVEVPLKGVAPSKVDILATTSTLKINFSPYLLDVVLSAPIDPLKHKAKVKNGYLHVTLFKQHSTVWKSLESDGDSETIRVEAESARQKLESELAEKRKDKKIEDERHALRKQMEIEERERSLLETKKEEEKKQAEEEVYSALSQLQSKQNGVSASQPTKHASNIAASATASEPRSVSRKEDIFDEMNLDDIDEDDSRQVAHAPTSVTLPTSLDDADIKYVPPPRSQATAPISFTPRVFPTPMRESKAAEEEDWVAKNRKHLKKHGVLGQNISKGNGVDISEEDASWLKAKGDDFYRTGDYRSAINAYSSALEVDENYIACLSNRAACYLLIGLPAECDNDCSDALRRIDAADEGTEDVTLRVKLLMRRGISRCQSGNYTTALADYETALNYNLGSPQEPQLRRDIELLQRLEQADKLKRQADSLFSTGELSAACDVYTQALNIIPQHVGCFSNRSACKIAMKDFEGCIADTTSALNIMESVKEPKIHSATSTALSMLSAILPPHGSDKAKAWKLKTLARRGAALAQLSRWDETVADYAAASSLDPSDGNLRSDLTKLMNRREDERKKAASATGGNITQ